MSKLWPVFIFAGFILLIFGAWGWRYCTAEVRGVVAAEEKVQSADFRLYSYDHFYDLCSKIRSVQANYDAQVTMRDELEEGSTERARTTQNISAIQAQIERLANQYNADARKEKTVGQFKASDLPERIRINQNEYGDRIACE